MPVGLWPRRSPGFVLFRIFDVDQAVPGRTLRAAARRPRRDGRRCDGGCLREPRRCVSSMWLLPALVRMTPLRRRCARPRSSRSAASCSDRRASTPTRSSSPSGWPLSASSCARRASSATTATIWRRSFRQALERVDLVDPDRRAGPDRRRPDPRVVARRAGPADGRGPGDRGAESTRASPARAEDAGSQPAAGDGAARRDRPRQPERHRAGTADPRSAIASSCCCPGRRAR